MRLSEVSPIDTTISALRRAYRARLFSRSRHFATGNEHLRAGELALDAEWREDFCPGLDAGIQVHRRALGHLLRAHDDVSAGHRSADLYNISASAWDAFSRPTQEFEGIQLHQRERSSVRASVLARLVRLSQAARRLRRITSRTRRSRPMSTSNSASRYGGAIPITTRTAGALPLPTRGWVTRFGEVHQRSGIRTAPSYRVPPEAPSLSSRPETIACLTNLYNKHGLAAWKRYGFVDAFNPLTGWTDIDVIGINQGITMLMAENYRTAFVWEQFHEESGSAARHEIGGFPAVSENCLQPLKGLCCDHSVKRKWITFSKNEVGSE